jgi:tetratricopeptide (TPR) repeat protein
MPVEQQVTLYQLRLLGDVALVEIASGKRLPLRRHSLALLVMLALASGREVSRTTVADLLWAGRNRASALGSLRQCIMQLDEACGGHSPVERGRHLLRLTPAIVTDLDMLRTNDSVTSAAAAQAAAGGPYLSGIELNESLGAWLAERRLWLAAVLSQGSAPFYDPPSGSMTTMTSRSVPPPRPLPPRFAATAPPLFLLLPIADRNGISGEVLRSELIERLLRFRELNLLDDSDTDYVSQGPALRLAGVLGEKAGGKPCLNLRLIKAPNQEVLFAETVMLDGSVSEELDRIEGQVASVSVLEDWPNTEIIVEASGSLYARFVRARMKALAPENHADALAAEAELRELIAIQPRFAFAPIALSRLLNTDYGYTRAWSSGPGERQSALALARRALEIDRSLSSAWLHVGFCLLRQQEWGAAALHIEQGAKLNPFDHTKLNIVATALLYLGHTERTEQILEKSLTLMRGPSDNYMHDLGFLRLVQGRAAEAYDALVSCSRPLPFTHILAAVAASQSGRDPRNAVSAAKRSLAPIFPGQTAPGPGELRDWFMSHHPFREHKTRLMIKQAIEQTFA